MKQLLTTGMPNNLTKARFTKKVIVKKNVVEKGKSPPQGDAGPDMIQELSYFPCYLTRYKITQISMVRLSETRILISA